MQICSIRPSSPGSSCQSRVDGAGAAQEQRDGRLGLERAERELVLGRDPQRRPARDDQLRARRRRQHAAELGRGRQHLLEVVDTIASVFEPDDRLELGQHARRIVEARRARSSARRPGRSAPRRCASSSANRVLPIPPGPVSVSSRVSSSSAIAVARSSSRPSSGPAGSGSGGAAGAARGGGGARQVERRILGQDRRLELLQLAARVQPELLDEGACAPAGTPPARRPGGRRGTAPASAARGSARGTGARRSAPPARRRAPRGGRARGRPRSAARARPAAARRSGRPRWPPGRAAARRPAAARGTGQRLAQQRARLLRRRRLGARDQRLEAVEVELARLDVDRVAGRAGDDRARAERPAQLGHVAPGAPSSPSRAGGRPTARRSAASSGRPRRGARAAGTPAARAAWPPSARSRHPRRPPAADRGSRSPSAAI